MPYETALTLPPTIPAIRGPDAPWDKETQWRGGENGSALARRQRHRGGGARRLRRDETVDGCYGRLGLDLAACGLRQPGRHARMKPNTRRCTLGLSTQRPWGLCRAPQYDWRVLLAQKRCPDTG
jgi:hypothetical protein